MMMIVSDEVDVKKHRNCRDTSNLLLDGQLALLGLTLIHRILFPEPTKHSIKIFLLIKYIYTTLLSSLLCSETFP